MKYLVVLCLAVVAVSGLPAKKTDYDDSDESFFLFPMGRQHKKEVPSVVEVEVGDSGEDTSFFPSYFRPLFINPFSFMNFGFSDFFSKPSWFDSLIPTGFSDDAIKNSTSSTKVVDGHKITVNETTYENEKNGAIYRLQVINISPVDSKEDGEKPVEKQPEQPEESELDTRTQTTENPKPDQNTHDNEIHREERSANYELQGGDPSAYDKNVEVIDVENHVGKRENVDLSGDIRVNALRAENTRRGGLYMIPEDVEVFDRLDNEAQLANYQQQQQIDAQEIIKPNFKQDAEFLPEHNNQQVVPPQYNQQIVPPQYNQGAIPSRYNQQVPPQYNQQVVPPQFNQGTVPSRYNQQVPSQYQQTVPPQYNQGVVPSRYNQQVPSQYSQYQQTVPPQYNQGAVPSRYNQQVPSQYQQTVPPQYNQGVVPSHYNQQVPSQYNQQVVSAQYNHQEVVRPQFNQPQI